MLSASILRGCHQDKVLQCLASVAGILKEMQTKVNQSDKYLTGRTPEVSLILMHCQQDEYSFTVPAPA